MPLGVEELIEEAKQHRAEEEARLKIAREEYKTNRAAAEISAYDPRYDPNLGVSTTQIFHQKAKNLGGSSLLGRTLDLLQRGEYMTTSALQDWLLAKPIDVGKAIEGLKGTHKPTYDEVVDEVFPDWNIWKRRSLSFGLSIFGEPFTYLPMGLPAKLGARGVKAIAKATPKTTGKLKKLGRGFILEGDLPKNYYELKYYSKTKLGGENKRILDDIAYLQRGLNEEDRKALTYFRQHPSEAHRMTPNLVKKLGLIGNRFDRLIDDALARGVIDKNVAARWYAKETPYVPGFYPEQGIKIAQGQIPPGIFEKTRKPTFLKQKKFETIEDAKRLSDEFLDVSQSKDLAELQGKIDQYNLQGAFETTKPNLNDMQAHAKAMAGYYKPEEDILKALAYRSLEQAGYAARKNFVRNTLEIFGEKIPSAQKVVPEGFGRYQPYGAIRFYAKDVIPDETLNALYKEFGDLIPADELAARLKRYPSITTKVQTYQLPKEIAQDLNRGFREWSPKSAIGRLLMKGQNAWKGMATAVRLPFHLRNMYSNWWQAYLSGINPAMMPVRLTQAGNIQKAVMLRKAGDPTRKIMKGTVKLAGKTYSFEDLVRLAEDTGVLGKGWLGADIARSHFKELDSILKYGRFRHLNPFKAGREFGAFIENNSRLAVFIDQLSKGANPIEASKKVRKYLFDYSELTEVEQKVMKNIWPFYTWSRKNIPLQIENLLTQPKKYAAYAKALRQFAVRESDFEKRHRPKWFDEMMYIKSPFKTPGGKPEYWSIDLPPLEINRMVEPRHWISSLSPYAILGDVLFNIKRFPEISKLRGQPLEKTQAPFWAVYLPDSFKQTLKKYSLIEYGPAIRDRRGRKILLMDKRIVHGLQGAFPFLNELNRIHAQPIFVDDEAPDLKWRSYRSGVSRSAISIPKEYERSIFEKSKDSEKLQRFWRQHKRRPTQYELEKLNLSKDTLRMMGVEE